MGFKKISTSGQEASKENVEEVIHNEMNCLKDDLICALTDTIKNELASLHSSSGSVENSAMNQSNLVQLQGIQDQLKTLEEENSSLRAALAQVDKVKTFSEEHPYYQYQSFPQELKDKLSDILKGDDFKTFVSCCAQENTIPAFWYKIKSLVNGDATQTDTLDKLALLYYYAISCYNTAQHLTGANKFILYNTSVGEDYNLSNHATTQDSSAQGIVGQCFLQGYQYGDTKAKSIVKIIPKS